VIVTTCPAPHGALVLSIAAVACASAAQPPAGDWHVAARAQMVETQIRARGITNPAVLDVMRRVPRHLFVPPAVEAFSYEDRPLPIGMEQTISQPYVVAYMTDALRPEPGHKVLEVGTGSGYQAAVLAELVGHVFSIEIVEELGTRARETLAREGYDNVTVRIGNGYAGWPEEAPFDRIIVTAAPPEIPKALVEQLAVGGRMVIPVGTFTQAMTIISKTGTGVVVDETIPVRFVPMVNPPGR